MKNLWGIYTVSWILVLHINKKNLSLSGGLSFFFFYLEMVCAFSHFKLEAYMANTIKKFKKGDQEK